MKIADMDKKKTDKAKTIMRKAYEVYNEIDALVGQLQREKADYEEVEELKSARDTACDVVDALQYIQENYGENDYR